MLDVTDKFVKEFSQMTKEEQIKKCETLTIEEAEVLSKNGFEFEINNGRVTDIERVN